MEEYDNLMLMPPLYLEINLSDAIALYQSLNIAELLGENQ